MPQCYDYSSKTHTVGKLPADIWLQCPSGNTCCVAGSVCLDHNLCHNPGPTDSSSGTYSSYYVARCSDPTFTSPDCQKVCAAPGPPDAVYNNTSQQWNCCGKDASGNVACDDPTSEAFQAPAPDDLKALSSGVAIVSTATLAAVTTTSTSASLGTSSTATTSTSATQKSLSSSTTASSVMTSTTNSTATSQPQQTNPTLPITASSPSLSTGAKAGIGIGIALAILLLGALIFFFLRRRRQPAASANTDVKSDVNGHGHGHGHTQALTEKNGMGVVEKSAIGDADVKLPRSELASNAEMGSGRVGGGVHELGTSR